MVPLSSLGARGRRGLQRAPRRARGEPGFATGVLRGSVVAVGVGFGDWFGWGWWDDVLALGAKVGDEVVDLRGGERVGEGGHVFAAVVDLFEDLFGGHALAELLEVGADLAVAAVDAVAVGAAVGGEEFCAAGVGGGRGLCCGWVKQVGCEDDNQRSNGKSKSNGKGFPATCAE